MLIRTCGKRFYLLSLLATIFFSCEKEYSLEHSVENKAALLSDFLDNNLIQLSRYYSHEPIDYIETDSIEKAETDLWPYVSEWLPDDVYDFGPNGHFTIIQNELKAPFNDSATITRPYQVITHGEEVSLIFVDYRYRELTYKFVSVNEESLTLSATWNGKVVFSEYRVIH